MIPYTYDVVDYGSMIRDQVRIDAYTKALREAVKAGCVVLDIGTGTGFFAMLACQYGARKVYAVEPASAIQLAREIAKANGYSDQIEFIQDLSTRVTLPEKVDVVISDLRGVLPLFQHYIPSIIDARQRFLSKGGVLIPKSDTLWASVVESSELYNVCAEPWGDNDHYGLDMRAGLRVVTNIWQKSRVKPERLLVEARCWATVDYTCIQNPDMSGIIKWTAREAGTAHGLGVWFDATLADGIHFSNAPDQPRLVYGSAFFPWSNPVVLSPGDTITASLHADLVGQDYIWRWDTDILDQGHPNRIKARFRQSTFYGELWSPDQMHKKASNHVPSLNEDGQIDQFILRLMDGKTSLEEISRRLYERFPTRFAKWQDALTHVSDLSQKYS